LTRSRVVLELLVSHSLCLHLREDVRLAQNEQLLSIDLDLGAAVLAVEDLVALGDVERNTLAVVIELAVADGQNLALLWLLLRGGGEADPTAVGLLFLDRPPGEPIAQGFELHVEPFFSSSASSLRSVIWHSRSESASPAAAECVISGAVRQGSLAL